MADVPPGPPDAPSSQTGGIGINDHGQGFVWSDVPGAANKSDPAQVDVPGANLHLVPEAHKPDQIPDYPPPPTAEAPAPPAEDPGPPAPVTWGYTPPAPEYDPSSGFNPQIDLGVGTLHLDPITPPTMPSDDSSGSYPPPISDEIDGAPDPYGYQQEQE